MKHEYLAKLVNEHPLAVLPAKLQQFEAFLQFRLAGGPPVKYEAAQAPAYRIEGSVAVIPVFGVLSQRINMVDEMSGGTSTEKLMARVREAVADPAVRAIVLQFDSPGGSVYGIQEAADEIRALGEQKRIVSHVDPLAASAAYWLASATSSISMTPSGEAGSIGVVSMHVDMSGALEAQGIKVTYIHAGANKVEGNPYQALGEDTASFFQSRVDEYYDAFVGAVAKGRGVPRSTVLKDFGQGRVFGAEHAKAVGMVDRVATLAEVVRGLQPRTRTSSKAAADLAVAEAILKAS